MLRCQVATKQQLRLMLTTKISWKFNYTPQLAIVPHSKNQQINGLESLKKFQKNLNALYLHVERTKAEEW